MENNIEELEEVKLEVASEEEMGPEESNAEFGEPAEDVELDELTEEEMFEESENGSDDENLEEEE